MKEIINISVKQSKQFDILDKVRKIANFLEVKCEVKYDGMTFGFLSNSCHFKLYCEAEENNMSKFKKEMS